MPKNTPKSPKSTPNMTTTKPVLRSLPPAQSTLTTPLQIHDSHFPNRSPKSKQPKTPRTHKPADMTLDDWQRALRREFGRIQDFQLKRIDTTTPLGEFRCTNPQTSRTYRLFIRSNRPGENFCTCPDFRINTLGTCKHLEFALKHLESEQHAGPLLASGFHPPFTEVFLRFGAERRVVVRRGADCPDDAWRDISRHLDPDSAISRASLGSHFEWIIERLKRNAHDVRLDDEAISFVAQTRDAIRLNDRLDKLLPKGLRSPLLDRLVKTPLYPYQKQGALFLARAGRSVLADDMGLGKTVQSLAAVELLARAAGVERVLVVTLTSTKHQWKHEIHKFTDRSARVVAGSQQTRISQLESDEFYKITSYDLLRADLDAVHRFSPDLVILDEAQRIKNWKTRTAQIVKRLQSQYAIVLTGTPVENRLEELHSILEFVDRYRLGPLFRFLHEHQITDNAGKVIGYEKLDQIATTLKPVMLRRTRDEVLKQLPSRIDSTHFVPMTPEQQHLHDSFKDVVAKLVFKWRKHRFLSEADQKRLQAALQSMRMAANSTYLIDPETEHGSKPDELINRLVEILEDPRQKVVVFSQWVRSHQLLMKRLDKLNINYAFLHGGIPGEDRDDIIQRFASDPNCRVFLSTDAGGIGLNLQSASSVLIMDQPWNPALLEQRIARVHRLGQKQPVSVLHFVSQGSIEEGILSLQSFKRSLFAGILDGGADTVHLGGSKLQQFVNSIEKATSAIGDPLIVESTSTNAIDHSPTTPPNDPWQSIIQQGQGLLSSLVQALTQQSDNIAPRSITTPPTDHPPTPESSTSTLEIARDPTGRPRLSVTLPSDAALQQFAQALANLARCFNKPD